MFGQPRLSRSDFRAALNCASRVGKDLESLAGFREPYYFFFLMFCSFCSSLPVFFVFFFFFFLFFFPRLTSPKGLFARAVRSDKDATACSRPSAHVCEFSCDDDPSEILLILLNEADPISAAAHVRAMTEGGRSNSIYAESLRHAHSHSRPIRSACGDPGARIFRDPACSGETLSRRFIR